MTWRDAVPRMTFPIDSRTFTPITAFQEKTMYNNFEIKEAHEASGKPQLRIDIVGIHALPYALKRLAEMGYDMSKTLTTLEEACEEQRKRKALEAAIADLTKPAEKAQ